MEIDTKGRYEDENRAGLSRIQAASNNNGINYYNTGVFDRAGSSFDLAVEVAKIFDIVDTISVYNAALSYEKAGMTDMAIARYHDCAEIEYQDNAALIWTEFAMNCPTRNLSVSIANNIILMQ